VDGIISHLVAVWLASEGEAAATENVWRRRMPTSYRNPTSLCGSAVGGDLVSRAVERGMRRLQRICWAAAAAAASVKTACRSASIVYLEVFLSVEQGGAVGCVLFGPRRACPAFCLCLLQRNRTLQAESNLARQDLLIMTIHHKIDNVATACAVIWLIDWSLLKYT